MLMVVFKHAYGSGDNMHMMKESHVRVASLSCAWLFTFTAFGDWRYLQMSFIESSIARIHFNSVAQLCHQHGTLVSPAWHSCANTMAQE